MTLIAPPAVLPQMPIVLLMAGNALLGHLHGARRIAVTAGALKFAVRPYQREMRIPGVIESPQRPAIRRVAGFTLLAQSPLVDVIMRMAVHAHERCAIECQRRVALGATDYAMQTHQGIFRQVMIEDDVGSP